MMSEAGKKFAKNIFYTTVGGIAFIVVLGLFINYMADKPTKHELGSQSVEKSTDIKENLNTKSTESINDMKLDKELMKFFDSIPDTPENKDFKEFVKKIKPVSKFNYCNCIPFHAIVEKDGCNFCRQFQAQCYNSKTISGCKDYFDFSEKGVDCIAMNKLNWWYKENSCQLA